MKFPVVVLASLAASAVSAQDLLTCELSLFRPFLLEKPFTTCGNETGYVFKSFAPLNATIIQQFCTLVSCRTALEPFVTKEYTECIAPIGTKDKKLVADFVTPIKTACFGSSTTTPPPTTPAPTTSTPPTPTPTTKRPSC